MLTYPNRPRSSVGRAPRQVCNTDMDGFALIEQWRDRAGYVGVEIPNLLTVPSADLHGIRVKFVVRLSEQFQEFANATVLNDCLSGFPFGVPFCDTDDLGVERLAGDSHASPYMK